MSSMTLKEFMTRGNGGMEKRSNRVYYDPEWQSSGKGPIRFLRTDEKQTKADATSFSPFLDAIPKLQNLQQYKDSEGYNAQLTQFRKDNPQFFNILEGFNRQFAPGILSGDAKTEDQLRLAARRLDIPEPFVSGYIDTLKEAGQKYSWILKDNPKMAEALALKYVNENVLKRLGVDPKMVRELMPGLSNYDMNQHIPGMAMAFGLPFGIGALLGHPGWGALLGLLGAGGYGYYQYNQMQNALLNAQQEKAKEEATEASAEEAALAQNAAPAAEGEAPAAESTPAVDREAASDSADVSTAGGSTSAGSSASNISDNARDSDEDVDVSLLDEDLDEDPEGPAGSQSTLTTPQPPVQPAQALATDKSKSVSKEELAKGMINPPHLGQRLLISTAIAKPLAVDTVARNATKPVSSASANKVATVTPSWQGQQRFQTPRIVKRDDGLLSYYIPPKLNSTDKQGRMFSQVKGMNGKEYWAEGDGKYLFFRPAEVNAKTTQQLNDLQFKPYTLQQNVPHAKGAILTQDENGNLYETSKGADNKWSEKHIGYNDHGTFVPGVNSAQFKAQAKK